MAQREQIIPPQSALAQAARIVKINFAVADEKIVQLQIAMPQLRQPQLFDDLNDLQGNLATIGQRIAATPCMVQKIFQIDRAIDRFDDQCIADLSFNVKSRQLRDGARRRDFLALKLLQSQKFPQRPAAAKEIVIVGSSWIKSEKVAAIFEIESPNLPPPVIANQLCVLLKITECLFKLRLRHETFINATAAFVSADVKP